MTAPYPYQSPKKETRVRSSTPSQANHGAGISLRGVRKRYRGSSEPAVRGIDLDIEPGEFMTFLGGSGAGKTTTLNMIAGFESVSAGQILLDGSDISMRPPYQRDLGMVFQNYALFPHLSVEDNIAFPLRQRRVEPSERRRKVAEALDLVDLGRLATRLPHELSGGQQQRVALARAIVYSPSVLLLDEPLGALDRRLRESLQEEISRVHRELGITFVYVTHDQEEALGMSDRIAVFRDGRLAQVGTPEEVYSKPQSTFIATFLGDSTVFTGRLDGNVLDLGWTRLALDSGTVSAASRNFGRNAEVNMIVRPEAMRVRTGQSASASEPFPSGVNVLDAVVTNVRFQGSYRRISVEFADGSDGLVREPADSALSVEVGAKTCVWWKSDAGALTSEQSSR